MPLLVPKVLRVFLEDGPFDGFPADTENSLHQVSALGEVPTDGWTRPRLQRDNTEPIDGIFGFNLIATPPTEAPADTTPVRLFASSLPFRISDSNLALRGVRVNGADNSITVRLPTEASEPYPTGDQITVRRASIESGQLFVDVSYSGGCLRHGFDLFWDGHLPRPSAPNVKFRLVHNANADPCEMLVRETLQFRLPELRPTAVAISTAFGFSTDIANGFSPLQPPLLGGLGGIPIIDRNFVSFLVKALTDPQLQESLKSNARAALYGSGLSADQIAFVQDDVNGGIIGISRILQMLFDGLRSGTIGVA